MFCCRVGPTNGCSAISLAAGVLPIDWSWVGNATFVKSDVDDNGVEIQIWSYGVSKSHR
jgi:hypothetical protein